MSDSLFTKIIKREIPSTIRYEDDEFIAIDDIYPQAPVHVLVIPKAQIETLENVDMNQKEFHSQLMLVGRKVAKIMGISENYRLIMNVGKDVQAVHHIHLHVVGGWKDAAATKADRLA